MGYNTEFDGEFAVEMAVAFATGRFGGGEIWRWKCA